MTSTYDLEASPSLGDSDREFKVAWDVEPIDRLQPGSEHHEYVLRYLNTRIEHSQREMSRFYSRWRMAEAKVQAYMHLNDYEASLREMNRNSRAPTPALIVFPYTFATISTIITYLSRVFCGRKPVFQLGTTKPEDVERVKKVETVLQYNMDYVKGILRLLQYFLDGELYGVCAIRGIWRQDHGRRTIWQPPSQAQLYLGESGMQRAYEDRVVFEGTDLQNVDPFMFFPDPNVPISEVNSKGEYVFWRNFVPRHELLSAEADGLIKHFRSASKTSFTSDQKWVELSMRNSLSQGRSHAGSRARTGVSPSNYQVDQGTCVIIPAELGLGESEYPEKWLFTIVGKSQIIQAEPLDLDHDLHPVVTAEPYTFGYAFGQPSSVDFLSPIQDLMSWMIDTHIYNVRAALQNMFVVDPSKVEMQDMNRPGPGKLIRLKPTAVGVDVRTVVQQLSVQDVTSQHMNELPAFIRIGDAITGVTENVRGTQSQSGRRTATESRITGEASVSRLAKHAMMHSAQGIVDLTRMMTMNLQQLLELDLYLEIVGRQGDFQKILPSDLTGDFFYPVHDGAMPLDRAQMAEVWEKILTGLLSDAQLRQEYNVGRVFETACESAGAINIQQYRNMASPVRADLQPDSDIADQVRRGNMVPIGVPGAGGPAYGAPPQ